jgi:hypothetical protein
MMSDLAFRHSGFVILNFLALYMTDGSPVQ